MTIGIVLCLSCLITGAIAALGDAHFFAWKEERKQKLTFIAQGSINNTYFREMTESAAGRYKIRGYIINLLNGRIKGHLEGYVADLELMKKWLLTPNPAFTIKKSEFEDEERIPDFEYTEFAVFNFNQLYTKNAHLTKVIDIDTQLHFVCNETLRKNYHNLYLYRMLNYTKPTPRPYRATQRVRKDKVIYERPNIDEEYDHVRNLMEDGKEYARQLKERETARAANRTTTMRSYKFLFKGGAPKFPDSVTNVTSQDDLLRQMFFQTTTQWSLPGDAKKVAGRHIPRRGGNLTGLGFDYFDKKTKATKTPKPVVTKKVKVKLTKEERKAIKKEEENVKRERKLEEAKNRTTTEKYMDRKRKPADPEENFYLDRN